MGMYTTIAVKAKLKPEFYGLAKVLERKNEERYLEYVPGALERKAFFSDTRWAFCMFGAYSFSGRSPAELFGISEIPWLEETEGVYEATGCLKNYAGTIDKYLSWLVPKIEFESGKYRTEPFAASQYEEDDFMTLYYVDASGNITSDNRLVEASDESFYGYQQQEN